MQRTAFSIQRVLSLLLILVMLFAIVACNQETTPSVTPPSTQPDESPESGNEDSITPNTPSSNETFMPTAEYVVVYGAEMAEDASTQEAIAYLNAAMQSTYGITLTVKDDSYEKTQGMKPAPFEILIGQTNRIHSQNLCKNLGKEDYSYLVQSKNIIVIVGGSLKTTKEAVIRFCADVIGYTEASDQSAKTPAWTLGATHIYRKYDSLTINGAPLSQWVVGVDPTSREAIALGNELIAYLASYTGEQLPLIAAGIEVEGRPNAICVGAAGREMYVPDYFDGEYYVSRQDSEGSVISMLSSADGGLRALMNRLRMAMVEQIQDKTVTLTIPEDERVYFAVEDYPTVPEWHLNKETKTELYDGVTYIEQLFYDENNLPYRTYVLIVDPDKVNFHMGSSRDGYEFAPSVRQTTLQHVQAAVANGKNIICGINANAFFMNGDYSPRGLAIKDGVLINRPTENLPFFAVTEDGEVIIDEADTFDAYVASGKKFTQGVGTWGGGYVLKNDFLVEGSYEPEQGPHPRSVIGRTADGKIILAVLDGRQRNHSNGSGFARLGLWMRSLGAVDVINLDGGGSSTFILCDPDTNSYKTCNRPSDGSLRKVYNSLLVELKEQ